MNLVSGNTAAVTITPATLTFNASNWKNFTIPFGLLWMTFHYQEMTSEYFFHLCSSKLSI
jgi:hypothetical protein